MAKQFDPKRILRQVSNHLLNDLFLSHGHPLDLPWEELSETQVNAIYETWQALPEKACRELEIVLHEIGEMTNEDARQIATITNSTASTYSISPPSTAKWSRTATGLKSSSRTGTGKTASFVLPILERIDLDSKRPQALVLTPTRELSEQVAAVSWLLLLLPVLNLTPITTLINDRYLYLPLVPFFALLFGQTKAHALQRGGKLCLVEGSAAIFVDQVEDVSGLCHNLSVQCTFRSQLLTDYAKDIFYFSLNFCFL